MPTADPSITSDAQRLQQAMAIAQRVAVTPGLYDQYEVENAFLKAIKVTNIEKLLPDPKGPNAVPVPPNPKLQIEEMKMRSKQAEGELAMKMGLLKLMGEAELNQAKIQKLQAEAESIKIGIATEGEKMRIQEINTSIALNRERREGILRSIDTMNKVYASMVGGQTEQMLQQAPESQMMGGMEQMQQPQLPM